MTAKKHLTLFMVGFLAWLSFYLLGSPSNYYTEWSQAEQILLSLLTFFAVVPFLAVLVLAFLQGDVRKTALWLAFYASAPLFVFDLVAVGIFQSQGFHFLVSHWYITIAYFYVWIDITLVGLALHRITRRDQGFAGSN